MSGRAEGVAGGAGGWISGRVPECACGRSHHVPIESVRVGEGVLDSVAELVGSGGRASALLIDDSRTREAAGRRVAAHLEAAGVALRQLTLPGEPHADAATVETILGGIEGAPDWVVAVGSGTINDLGKVVAGRLGALQLTVGTAASMNGYTSSIAAMTERGLKLTLPAAPPRRLLFDTGVLAAAPPRLAAAGFGDLMSKSVSSADWLVSCRLFGETPCSAALELADGAVSGARRHAAGLRTGDPAAHAALIEALLLSGLSMSLAGASSPASGGEHLISHYLDIAAEGLGREPRLHGEQVAVATLVSRRIYAALREAGVPEPRTALGARGSGAVDPIDLAGFDFRHRHLSPECRAEVLEQAREKQKRRPRRAERLLRLTGEWDALWAVIDPQLDGGAGIEEDLRRAGCPCRFDEIDVCPDIAREVLLAAREMRARYTVLDLAHDLGRLEPLADELSRS